MLNRLLIGLIFVLVVLVFLAVEMFVFSRFVGEFVVCAKLTEGA